MLPYGKIVEKHYCPKTSVLYSKVPHLHTHYIDREFRFPVDFLFMSSSKSQKSEFFHVTPMQYWSPAVGSNTYLQYGEKPYYTIFGNVSI